MSKFTSSKLISLLLISGFANQGVCYAQSTGAILLSEEEYNALPKQELPLGGSLPEFIDLSKFLPTPGNQGVGQSSCVGWAVGHGLRTYMLAFEHSIEQPDFSFSPSYLYNQINPGRTLGNCKTGSKVSDALRILENEGVPPTEFFPYYENNCSATPDQPTKAMASNYKIGSWGTANTLNEMKSHLAGGNPVILGMMVGKEFQDFRSPDDDKFEIIEKGTDLEGHALLAVGYNDVTKSFKVMNSWGENWGSNGFAWVDYKVHEANVKQMYVAHDDIFSTSTLEHVSTKLSDAEPLAARLIDPASAVTPTQVFDAVAHGLRNNVGLEESKGNKPKGFTYYPAAMWIDLEDSVKSQIQSVKYRFPHSTFPFPLIPDTESDSFLVKWSAWGSLDFAYVDITLVDGHLLEIRFPQRRLWENGKLNADDKKQRMKLEIVEVPEALRLSDISCPPGTKLIPENNTCQIFDFDKWISGQN